MKRMNNFNELLQQLKDGLITEEQLFELMTDTNGLFHLKRGKITKTGTEKKRLYFGGTVIGYGDELKAPIKFLEGSHEEALPYYEGIPYLLFHKGDMIPIGKVTEVWMDDNKEIKYTAWSQDEEYNESIEEAMMDSQSLGFDPLEYEFNFDTWEFDISKYRPMEISGVVFPAYADAKTEAIGETAEEVKEAMTDTLSSQEVQTSTTSNDKIWLTTTETTPYILADKEESEEMEKLKKENKILKFLTKYPNIKNREQIMELMEKYDISEEDADKLVVEEKEEEKQEVVEEEETTEITDNPPLPVVQEPIGDEPVDSKEDIEARIADRSKKGFGSK